MYHRGCWVNTNALFLEMQLFKDQCLSSKNSYSHHVLKMKGGLEIDTLLLRNYVQTAKTSIYWSKNSRSMQFQN